MFARIANDKNDHRVLVQVFCDFQGSGKDGSSRTAAKYSLVSRQAGGPGSNDSRSVTLMISSMICISALPTGRLWPIPRRDTASPRARGPILCTCLNIDPYGSAPMIFDLRVHFLQITSRAADRSARADARDKMRDLAFRIVPDLGAGRYDNVPPDSPDDCTDRDKTSSAFPMRCVSPSRRNGRACRVLPLPGRRRCRHRGSSDNAFFRPRPCPSGKDAFVATSCRDHGQANAGVTRRRLDQWSRPVLKCPRVRRSRSSRCRCGP